MDSSSFTRPQFLSSMFISMHICMYVFMYVCFVFMYVCMYVCPCENVLSTDNLSVISHSLFIGFVCLGADGDEVLR